MREIKFRAWDNVLKEMMSHEQLMEPVRGKFLTYAELTEFPTNDAVLMQFTGLLDKNGAPIYEGDIILAREETDAKDRHWRVTFVDGRFCAETARDLIGLHYWTPCGLEVVGNIHQHSHLLP